jgi:hypothetical protein
MVRGPGRTATRGKNLMYRAISGPGIWIRGVVPFLRVLKRYFEMMAETKTSNKYVGYMTTLNWILEQSRWAGEIIK